MLLISRNNITGHAEYRVVKHPAPHPTATATAIPTPKPVRDTRDVPFATWCETHHHQLRRMLRYMQSRLACGTDERNPGLDIGVGWDWDGITLSLARYVYSTSENRRRTTPSIT